jgi:8-oxo-dGTP diphosphatase
MNNRPKVGVSVVLKFKNKVLVGKRKGSHGDGTWAFPGGHLEFGETIFDCGKRELEEETNIDLGNLKGENIGYTNDIFQKEKKHYITLYVLYTVDKELKAEVMEPNKCYEWIWVNENKIPKPHFIPLQNYLKIIN